MKILVLNCGSSSIKYQLFDMPSGVAIVKGIVEKIGMIGSFLKHTRTDGDVVKLEGEIVDHQNGIEYVLGVLISEKHGCISNLNEIIAVGHRVTHGGEKFCQSAEITAEIMKEIKGCIELAPLHNPHNLRGILAIESLLPDAKQVAVFDTAFHQTMPKCAYMYALPFSLYKKHGIRRYGFHGTSYRFVMDRACEFVGERAEDLKIIACHLGNGASIAAILNGKSVDTSMGLTPIEGLMMGTRSGDVDLGVLTFMMDKEELDMFRANTLINKHSGMLGISGISSDMREIENAANNGNENAQLAIDMYQYRVRKYIGAYASAMNGVDMIIFTGGIGENACSLRKEICKNLSYLGVDFDFDKNDELRGQEAILTKPGSKVKVVVIPTNEELIIAKDTYGLV